MKNLSKLFIVGLIAIGLTACGTAQNPQQTGYYNSSGQWVPTVGGVQGGNACITTIGQPLSLSFSATGIDVVQGRFFAGNIPQFGTAAGAHGSVTLAGGGQQSYSSISLNKTSSGGSINMILDPNSRTASGTIQISPTSLANTGVMNSIMYGNQQYGGQYGAQNTSTCVTSIAIDVTYSSSGSYNNQMATGQLYMAMIYLYLSNGQVAQAPAAI